MESNNNCLSISEYFYSNHAKPSVRWKLILKFEAISYFSNLFAKNHIKNFCMISHRYS